MQFVIIFKVAAPHKLRMQNSFRICGCNFSEMNGYIFLSFLQIKKKLYIFFTWHFSDQFARSLCRGKICKNSETAFASSTFTKVNKFNFIYLNCRRKI